MGERWHQPGGLALLWNYEFSGPVSPLDLATWATTKARLRRQAAQAFGKNAQHNEEHRLRAKQLPCGIASRQTTVGTTPRMTPPVMDPRHPITTMMKALIESSAENSIDDIPDWETIYTAPRDCRQ